MAKCPAPGCACELLTTDPNNADWVALGQVVCSQRCHELMYDPQAYLFTEEEMGVRVEAKTEEPPDTAQDADDAPQNLALPLVFKTPRRKARPTPLRRSA